MNNTTTRKSPNRTVVIFTATTLIALLVSCQAVCGRAFVADSILSSKSSSVHSTKTRTTANDIILPSGRKQKASIESKRSFTTNTIVSTARGGNVVLASVAKLVSAVKGEEDDDNISLPKERPPLPTFQQYQKFAIPCLALWIAGPLLSLVDTSFIGLSGEVSQSAQLLAALGPATTFFDGATYLFQFLNVATTNLYSSSRAQHGEQSDQAEAVVRTSARVAIRCGFWLMLFLFVAGRPLLSLYIGEKATAMPGLLKNACEYVYIRALSMPTSLLLGVLQASLLGAQDSVTPLIAIYVSTVVNVIGDYLLVNRFNYGLQGAAIATTLAQWASTAALIPASRRRLVRDGNLGFFKKGKDTEGSVTSKSFLAFAAPVLTLILGKLSAFGFMTHSAAAVPGQPIPLASHQIILSLLFFCSPFLEVISQTAQTFLPPFFAPVNAYTAKKKEKDPEYDPTEDTNVQPWLESGQKVATRLLGIGFISAACIASIASLIPRYFGYFVTSDTVIQEAVKPMAKYLWLGAFIWAPVAVSEGVLLARRELKFLASIYLISTALLPPALLKVKYMPNGNVGHVWFCFVVFQLFRATAFMGRIWGEFAYQRIHTIVKNKKIVSTTSSNTVFDKVAATEAEQEVANTLSTSADPVTVTGVSSQSDDDNSEITLPSLSDETDEDNNVSDSTPTAQTTANAK